MTDFDAICQQLRTLKAAGLADTDSYRRLSDLALQNAPDWLMTKIMDDAVREGMLPPPMGIDQSGERVWKLEDVARHFGLSEAEAKTSLEKFQLEQGDVATINPASIHRMH